MWERIFEFLLLTILSNFQNIFPVNSSSYFTNYLINISNKVFTFENITNQYEFK